MEKIKTKRLRSIRSSFILYTLVCLVTAVLLSLASCALMQYGTEQIQKRYEEEHDSKYGVKGYLVTENGDRIDTSGIQMFSQNIESLYTPSERVLTHVFNFLNIALVPVWFVLCIGLSSALFYKRKLRQPLEAMGEAARNIAQNNLDFSMRYTGKDEMGALCATFEKMRAALRENQKEMWRQVEERKELNAAFSHDLRTPLTVLRGQSEILMKFVPAGKLSGEKITETAGVMHGHILRLERYVEAMSTLQRLEDIEVCRKPVEAAELEKALRASAGLLCGEKALRFTSGLSGADRYEIDSNLVMQVFENLMANAARFARREISVTLSDTGGICLTVADDGEGFDELALERADEPFFQSGNTAGGVHFGMGLAICKTLCAKHGGRLKLRNSGNGACAEAHFL